MEKITDVLVTRVMVTYEQTDISQDVSSDLLSFSFSDKIGTEADELRIVLKDETLKWAGSWSPDRGAKIEAVLTSNHGFAPLKTGKMIVDRLETSSPPSVFSLSAVSIPLDNPIRRKARTRNFEQISFNAIASQVASENGMAFMFDCEENPKYDRIDQREESDLEFVDRLAREAGATVKISNNMLIVFDQKSYENKEPVATISRTGGWVISYNFTAQQSQRYRKCTIRYRNIKKKTKSGGSGAGAGKSAGVAVLAAVPTAAPASASARDVGSKPEGYDINLDPASKGSQQSKPEIITYTCEDNTVGPGGQEYSFRRRCTSLAEAERLCRAKLRELNLRQTTGTINMVGCTDMVAGCVVELQGFGSFDGNFIIEVANHEYSGSGYTTSLQLRRVNNNY